MFALRLEALTSEYVLKYSLIMSITLEPFQSSELSRNPARAFSAAEQSPILVTRRDGEDLVLMSQSEAAASRALLEFAAELIAVTTDDRGSLTERMANRFPWMLALSAEDKEQCARDLVDAARASFATQQPHKAVAELTSWKETASAVAGGLGKVPIVWLDDLVEVRRPEQP